MAWQEPKTDWVANPKNPKCEDFNRIEGNIDFLKTDIETKKGEIVNAINDMNQAANITDTHTTLAGKIRDISKDASAGVGDVEKGKTFYSDGSKKTGTLELTGNAATGDVLSGKTFYNTALKTKRTGIMANQGTKIITPTTSDITIPKGFHSGQGYVKGDTNLVPGNILQGKSIFGVAGSIIPGKRWATGTYTGSSPLDITGLAFAPTLVFLYAIADHYEAFLGVAAKDKSIKGIGAMTSYIYANAGYLHSGEPTFGTNSVTGLGLVLPGEAAAKVKWYAFE